MKTVEEARATLQSALKHFRFAVADAAKEGTPLLAVVAEHHDGGGKLVMKFNCGEFFEDLALVIGASDDTDEEKLEANAAAFKSKFNLRTMNDE
jgi:hypothetical protein